MASALAAGAAFGSAALLLGSLGKAATEGPLEPVVPVSDPEHATNSSRANPREERETERVWRSF
jgi:hypothetical protein